MSTERVGRRMEFICDECDASSEDFDADDFKIEWDELKDEGWRAYKDGRGIWCHVCPDCRSK